MPKVITAPGGPPAPLGADGAADVVVTTQPHLLLPAGSPLDLVVGTPSVLQLAAWRAPRVAAGWVLHVDLQPPGAVPGYARPAVAAPPRASTVAALAAAPRSSTGTAVPTSSTSTGASTSTSGEWGFLNDKKMSIEDKLFLFMQRVQKRNDDVLDAKMKEYKEKFVDKKGLFGGVGSFFSGLASALAAPEDLLVKGFAELIKDLGPKAFEQVVSLVAPGLGPLARQVAAPFAKLIAGDVLSAVSSSSSSSGSGASSSTEAGSPDEKLAMFELQRLVEKQNQMFNAISNILKNMHETAMNTIGNFR